MDAGKSANVYLGAPNTEWGMQLCRYIEKDGCVHQEDRAVAF